MNTCYNLNIWQSCSFNLYHNSSQIMMPYLFSVHKGEKCVCVIQINDDIGISRLKINIMSASEWMMKLIKLWRIVDSKSHLILDTAQNLVWLPCYLEGKQYFTNHFKFCGANPLSEGCGQTVFNYSESNKLKSFTSKILCEADKITFFLFFPSRNAFSLSCSHFNLY